MTPRERSEDIKVAKRGKNLLTPVQLQHWIRAREPIARTDGDGLTFTLSAAGTATWVLRYQFGGRSRELTLGNYPDISLPAARQLAREKRVEIDKGGDPAITKKQEKIRVRATWSTRELAEDYREKIVAALAESTQEARNADLDQVIIPKLGSMLVTNVTSADIVGLIADSGRTWTMCKRLRSTCNRLFAHALGKRLIHVNPTVGIDLISVIGQRPPVRRRLMLSQDELRTLLPDINSIGIENALAFRIMLATCVRTIELVKAQWANVDLDKGTWIVTEETVKTRRGYVVPLCPTVVSWFRELKKCAGDSRWVLPARRGHRRARLGGDTHVGNSTLWAALTRRFERGDLDIRRFTPHDTRSTAKSHMKAMGVSNEVSERSLNHVLKGMEEIYDQYDYLPERQAALELWAAFLTACEQGHPWTVVPLRRAA
ncbi:MAG: tyrosine-type recombinase/integrase [Comamonadaceae bacterium]|nr:tyrosine-type recombinase/integrase [Comamonadaceae bacterium]